MSYDMTIVMLRALESVLHTKPTQIRIVLILIQNATNQVRSIILML